MQALVAGIWVHWITEGNPLLSVDSAYYRYSLNSWIAIMSLCRTGPKAGSTF